MIDDENQWTSWKMGDTSSDYLNLSLVSFLKLTKFQGCNCRVSLFNLFLWVEIRRYFWKVTKHCWAEEKVQEAELRDNLWLTLVAFCTEVCLFSSSPPSADEFVLPLAPPSYQYVARLVPLCCPWCWHLYKEKSVSLGGEQHPPKNNHYFSHPY